MAAAGLPAWEFDDPADGTVWAANSMLSNASVQDGMLSADATDWDPFWHARGIEIPARSNQYILMRIRSDKPGSGCVFWSGEVTGENGGLTEKKKCDFAIRREGDWETFALFPFWQGEGTIRQLRLDVYEGAHFDVDWIRILELGGGEAPKTDLFRWEIGGGLGPWWVHPESYDAFAPPVSLDVRNRGWVTVHMRSGKAGTGSFLWGSEGAQDLQSESFALKGDGEWHTYNIELAGEPSWQTPVVAIGLRLPLDESIEVGWVAIEEEPSGPPELVVDRFDFVNMPNRAGLDCEVTVRVRNIGGSSGPVEGIRLEPAAGLDVVVAPEETRSKGIFFKEYKDFVWRVRAVSAGTYAVQAIFEGDSAPAPATAELTFTEPLGLPKADYVPEPRPIETDIDICAYYFPGWHTYSRWDCIRDVGPVRKPMLGYYDESLPEVIDWQIKWAVENGITCFLVDWYWSAGGEHLRHWFDAYRETKYRDYLQVAIMWANHNAPNTHSVEDWRNVTREWIDKYFNLPSYYRIDGKPAVFIWAPSNIRRDVGGSDVVKQMLDESQEMAKQAGYEGITFVAMGYDFSKATFEALAKEGYVASTTYHEWGNAADLPDAPRLRDYADVAATVEESWAGKNAGCAPLEYYPVADTGWDSRPWHGDKALVFRGRTPALFEDILRKSRAFCEANDKKLLILAPLNEWGEGSYIEPATEYGFEMYEAIRRVWGKGNPEEWPVNVAPVDVGRGPYDFAVPEVTSEWDFEEDAGGWAAMMGVRDVRCEDGELRFTTTSSDPAITNSLGGLPASERTKLVVTMSITVPAPGETGAQLFWSSGGSAITEATSVHFRVQMDGAMHTYEVDLTANPRWRRNISTLRFDTGSVADAEVRIADFRLVE